MKSKDLIMKHIILFLALALSLVNTSNAAVSVSPVHLGVAHDTRSTSLKFINDTDKESVIDVRVFKWVGQKDDGSDILEDTNSIILSRPVVMVPAHGELTIRIIVKTRTSNAEDAYRVVVTDITPAAKDGTVAVRMNSVLPLFVLNAKNSRGVLKLNDGVLTNTGDRHVRIGGYTDRNGDQVKMLRYVFPGQSISLSVQSGGDVIASDDIY